jgi:hypothetical protein
LLRPLGDVSSAFYLKLNVECGWWAPRRGKSAIRRLQKSDGLSRARTPFPKMENLSRRIDSRQRPERYGMTKQNATVEKSSLVQSSNGIMCFQRACCCPKELNAGTELKGGKE